MSSALGSSLPNRWGASRLKHMTCLLNRGSAPNYVDDGPVRAISQSANQSDGLDWSRTRFHNYDGDATKLKGYLQQEDVLINSTGTGTLGRVGFFTGAPDNIPCMADSHVTIARTKSDELHPRFAYYWLGSQPFQEYVYAALAVGATNQIELNRESLGNAPVPVPPLEEQRRIAHFLDAETARIDRVITKRRRMRNLLRLKRNRIIDTELGFDNRASVHGLTPLKYLAEEITVGIVITPAKWYVENSGVPALRGLNVQPGKITIADLVCISEEGHAENWKSRLRAGDVVVVRTGQAGAAAVVPASLDGANCIDLILVRPGDAVSPKYLEYVLNSDYASERVSEHSVGSIQAHFNVGAMKQLPVPALSRSQQDAIVESLDRRLGSIDQLLGKFKAQEALLAERRQSVITAAVSGQIDVSTASGRGVEE
ncbi:restriction endonuclease subunit S [Streptomyces collinus]|uniref:restriction endonuclease subunit S n=1 Tax=Streptomyces collinus TaxID=42684 RepID=UPI00340C9CFA